MQPSIFIPVLFIGIALIFVAASLRAFLYGKNKQSIAGKIWLSMAFIFSVVAISLFAFSF